MSTASRSGGIVWRIMRWLNPRLLGKFRSGGKPGQFILLLKTTGRKTGREHLTPLQYEWIDDAYYVASARGRSADWFQNILLNPAVKVEIRGKEFAAHAEAITDPVQIADFIELRTSRHPLMIGTMLRLEGFPAKYSRSELEDFASQKALVILHPATEVETSFVLTPS